MSQWIKDTDGWKQTSGNVNPGDINAVNTRIDEYEQSGYLSRNLCKYSIVLGTRGTSGKIGVSSADNALSGVVEIEPNTQYTVSIDGVTSVSNFRFYKYVSSDETTLSVTQNLGTVTLPYTFTSGANEHGFSFQSGSNTSLTGKNVQIEKGNTASEYMPYAPSNTELQSEINPSGYISSGLTYTNCSYVDGGYFKIGNVVVINMRVVLSGDGVINGFPQYNGSYNVVNINGFSVSSGISSKVNGWISPQGEMQIRADNTSSNIILISAIYLSK